MPYKHFQLGMYAAEREMDILKQIQKHGSIHHTQIGYDKDLDLCLTSEQIIEVLGDLKSMGLIRFCKVNHTFSLTKKAQKFLKEQS